MIQKLILLMLTLFIVIHAEVTEKEQSNSSVKLIIDKNNYLEIRGLNLSEEFSPVGTKTVYKLKDLKNPLILQVGDFGTFWTSGNGLDSVSIVLHGTNKGLEVVQQSCRNYYYTTDGMSGIGKVDEVDTLYSDIKWIDLSSKKAKLYTPLEMNQKEYPNYSKHKAAQIQKKMNLGDVYHEVYDDISTHFLSIVTPTFSRELVISFVYGG